MILKTKILTVLTVVVVALSNIPLTVHAALSPTAEPIIITNENEAEVENVQESIIPPELSGIYNQSIWETLSDDERKVYNSIFIIKLSEYLDISVPKINYIDDKTIQGNYSTKTNAINLSNNWLFSGEKAYKTLCHEARHAYQWKKSRNPITEEDYIFRDNYNNYISAFDDLNGYKNQPLEKDAKEFENKMYQEFLQNIY